KITQLLVEPRARLLIGADAFIMDEIDRNGQLDIVGRQNLRTVCSKLQGFLNVRFKTGFFQERVPDRLETQAYRMKIGPWVERGNVTELAHLRKWIDEIEILAGGQGRQRGLSGR